MYIFPGGGRGGNIIIVGINISLKLSICNVWHSIRIPRHTRRQEKETAIGQTPGIQLMELSGSDFKITMLAFKEIQYRLRISAENWILEKRTKWKFKAWGGGRGWVRTGAGGTRGTCDTFNNNDLKNNNKITAVNSEMVFIFLFLFYNQLEIAKKN